MKRPPCVMKWHSGLASYVPVTDPVEASELAKRCVYRSADYPGFTVEQRATMLLAELGACDTEAERRKLVAEALMAESATPVHRDLADVEPVDLKALERWTKWQGMVDRILELEERVKYLEKRNKQ